MILQKNVKWWNLYYDIILCADACGTHSLYGLMKGQYFGSKLRNTRPLPVRAAHSIISFRLK